MALVVAAFVGSITAREIGAHAIVNASNPEVALGSGVSGAIRDACGGAAYQAEIRARWTEDFDSPLEPGDCLVTGPGASTAFRWVLHVPAVDYRHPDPETRKPSGPKRVARCFESALEASAGLARDNDLAGRFVLATALLGAGAGGLGAVTSADAMLGALATWARSSPDAGAMKRVVLTVLSEEDARLIRLAADRHAVSCETLIFPQ